MNERILVNSDSNNDGNQGRNDRLADRLEPAPNFKPVTRFDPARFDFAKYEVDHQNFKHKQCHSSRNP